MAQHATIRVKGGRTRGPLTIPFLFGMAPLAGILREATGNYTLAVSLFIAGFLIAMLCFLLLASRERTSKWRSVAAP